MADVWANSMACHPRATCHILVLPPGEFNGRATVPRVTLQGAATWWIHCHDSSATCHIEGCKISSAILKTVFRHILLFFLFPALTSGGFCIVSDTLVYILIRWCSGRLFHGFISVRDSHNSSGTRRALAWSCRWNQLLYHPRLAQTQQTKGYAVNFMWFILSSTTFGYHMILSLTCQLWRIPSLRFVKLDSAVWNVIP